MFAFLDDYYERTGADDVAALLSGLSLMADDKPVDPAFWADWQIAVKKATSGIIDASFQLQ